MCIVRQVDNEKLQSQIHSCITAVGSGKGREMNHARKAFTLELLKRHNIMSFATIWATGLRKRPRSPMPIHCGDVIYLL